MVEHLLDPLSYFLFQLVTKKAGNMTESRHVSGKWCVSLHDIE